MRQKFKLISVISLVKILADRMTDKLFLNTFIVGIGGATNSGKSSLAKRLVNSFPGSVSICQDTYFMDPGDARLEHLRIPELDCWNWENIEALDMEKMVKDVESVVESQRTNDSCSVLFVEGFLIYNYQPLLKFFRKKYFLTMQKEECKRRRSGRTYNPPDGPQYFDKIVWPEYVQLIEKIKLQQDICFIDGTRNADDIYGQVCQEIKQLHTENT